MRETQTAEDTVEAAELIARHLAATRYEDLPREVVTAVKEAILDTLGCLLAGTATREMDAIVSLVAERGGKPVSTVIGRKLSVPAEAAVLANAAAIHQYDYDDTHDIAVCHPSSSSLIPALALGEAKGKVTGKDLITAVALGNDLTSRVAYGIGGRLVDYPFFRAPVAGIFGATAASAKILGASPAQHRDALGLALPMVSGTLSSLQHGGSSVRSIRDGLSYRNGVLAAELAMRGVRGDRNVFDGPFGLYGAFFRGERNTEGLMGGLGKRWETHRISLKPWPAIRHTHCMLTAVTNVLTREKLAFEDVDSVRMFVGKINQDRSRPVQLGTVPDGRMDLLGNLAFVVAAVLRLGTIPLAVYRDSELCDKIVREALPKVSWEYDPACDGPWTFEPARLELRTKRGAVHQEACKIALGNPDNPMSEAQRLAKFYDCAKAARVPLAKAQSDAIVEAVAGLDRLADIGGLARLLT